MISKTTNGGDTWSDLLVRDDEGHLLSVVAEIAIDPTAPSTLYVAGRDQGLFKSMNGGLSWQFLNNGLFPGDHYDSLAVDPVTPSTIYAGSGSFGVFQSTDGGGSWVRRLPKNVSVHALAVEPVSPSTVYAGTSGANMFRSTDKGITWMSLEGRLPNSFIQALAIDPVNTSTVYAGASGVGDGFVVKMNAAGSALLRSTYLGGDDVDVCNAIAIDSSGTAYVVGTTYSKNFPAAGPIQQSPAGSIDAFVAKLNLSDSVIVYAEYLGGSNRDEALGVAVDLEGNAYVTGFTFSTDFPTAAPLTGSEGDPEGSGFVTNLNPSGAALIFSTYLGGKNVDNFIGFDQGSGIAVDSGGSAYVTGLTSSAAFPTTPGTFQASRAGFNSDAFVSKLSMFDLCLQDDSNGNWLLVNTSTGDYLFTACRGGVALSGNAVITRKGCLISLQVSGPDRRLLARIDTCLKTGTATMQIVSQGASFTILDRNITNNTCKCSG